MYQSLPGVYIDWRDRLAKVIFRKNNSANDVRLLLTTSCSFLEDKASD
jgi:hypothetical protein